VTLLLVCTVLLVVLTKAFDSLTTLYALPHASAETNPIARRWMARLGVRRAVFLVFCLATVWVCTLAATVALSGSTAAMLLFIGAALLVATIQAAVEHTNWIGSWSLITRRILQLHRRLEQRGAVFRGPALGASTR